MATALSVTDTSAPQGNDRSTPRATSAPAGEPDPPGSAEQKQAAPTSAAAPSSGHNTSADTLADGTSGQSGASPFRGPNRESAIDAATQRSAAEKGRAASSEKETAGATRGGTTAETPQRPPGQAEKPENAEKKAQQKGVGKSAAER
jgi:hypothetical protein